MKKQSFLTGAVILMAANAVSKILGAVFKIPLTYIVQEDGMAVFNTAFHVYIMVLSFVICGFPLAISKGVAEALSSEKPECAHKLVKVSVRLLLVLGAAGTAAAWIGAPFFAGALKEPNAVFAIRMIAPSIIFVAWGVAYKSFYQGTGNMIPTAISQVVEAVFKLFAGYYLAVYFYSISRAYAAGGAVLGITLGEIVATLILWGLYLPEKQRTNLLPGETKSIVKELSAIALPLLLTALISNMMSLIDISVIRLRLTECQFSPEDAERLISRYGEHTDLFQSLPSTGRMSGQAAGWLYGAYSGYAATIFNLPVGILATFGVSLLPVIAGSLAAGKQDRAGRMAERAMGIIAFFSVPCTIGVYFLSEELLGLLFHDTASALMLKSLAPCIFTVCLTQIAASVLHGSGRIFLPFVMGFAGDLIKLVLEWFLITDPRLNILGAPISSCVSDILVMTGILWAVRRFAGIKFRVSEILLKPWAGGVCMILMLVYFLPIIRTLFLGNTAILAVTGVMGLLTYGLSAGLLMRKTLLSSSRNGIQGKIS